jgi:hypothetical protein
MPRRLEQVSPERNGREGRDMTQGNGQTTYTQEDLAKEARQMAARYRKDTGKSARLAYWSVSVITGAAYASLNVCLKDGSGIEITEIHEAI